MKNINKISYEMLFILYCGDKLFVLMSNKVLQTVTDILVNYVQVILQKMNLYSKTCRPARKTLIYSTKQKKLMENKTTIRFL